MRPAITQFSTLPLVKLESVESIPSLRGQRGNLSRPNLSVGEDYVTAGYPFGHFVPRHAEASSAFL